MISTVRVSFFGSFRVRVRFWLGPGTGGDLIYMISGTQMDERSLICCMH